jgi:hypothetical protein
MPKDVGPKSARIRSHGHFFTLHKTELWSSDQLRAMKPVHIYFAVMVILAGCKSSPSSTVSRPLNSFNSFDSNSISYEWSERLMIRKIHLSPNHPADSDIKIRLVSVGSDSTATIRLDSGQQLTAKPGEYFACEQFGSQGLKLVSASPETGAAELQLTSSETESSQTR